ncbi:hypothetical protein AZA_28595 [Nitrospirillum viridazoti Y2]|nr:hypothetical protein AZA_28595 [Nitrospirillum amazonense Y2]
MAQRHGGTLVAPQIQYRSRRRQGKEAVQPGASHARPWRRYRSMMRAASLMISFRETG